MILGHSERLTAERCSDDEASGHGEEEQAARDGGGAESHAGQNLAGARLGGRGISFHDMSQEVAHLKGIGLHNLYRLAVPVFKWMMIGGGSAAPQSAVFAFGRINGGGLNYRVDLFSGGKK